MILEIYRRLRREAETVFYKHASKKEINSRANLQLSDINDLIRDIPVSYHRAYTPEKFEQNDFYGHANNFKRYASLPSDLSLKTTIEHGLYLGKYAWPLDIKNDSSGIITFGKAGEKRLKEFTKKRVTPVGPYIHYAESFLSPQEMKSEKKKLGKNLLVFHVHSDHFINAAFDYSQYCKSIQSIAKNFNTVTICLYWKDALSGTYKFFKEKGFHCVSAGHMFDPLFLSRMRSIIELSDLAISNDVGTNIGYCVTLNRPFNIVKQKVKFSNSENVTPFSIDERKEIELIKKAFLKETDVVTPLQKEIVDYYWGLSLIKTNEEMHQILTDP